MIFQFMTNTRFGDLLVRRTPGLYGRFRVLLEEADIYSLKERRELRERLTAQAMQWAVDTDYARKRQLSDNYYDWPILEKDTIRDERRSFNRCVSFPVSMAETGGSTGIPLQLRRSWQSVVFEQAVLDHLAWKHGGVNWAKARIASLRGDNIKDPSDMSPPFWRLYRNRYLLSFSSNHLNPKTIDQYMDAIINFRPDMLWVYPTSLEALCKLSSVDNIPHLKLVYSASEVLPRDLFQEVRDRFGVRVVDGYGLGERVAYACSANDGERCYFVCPYGRVELHFVHEDEEHDLYEIIGTSYWNMAMPLVRYRTGDHARLPKGSSRQQIEETELGLRPFLGITGRQSDYLVSPEGGYLIGINQIPRGVRDIVQMQFHQYTKYHIVIQVVPKPAYSSDTEKIIMQKSRMKIPQSVKIEIQCVEQLYRTPQNKLPMVVKHSGMLSERDDA